MRVWVLVLVLVLANVIAISTGYADWVCDQFPWSKGCWGSDPVWRWLQ
jgi:hypothetical protein